MTCRHDFGPNGPHRFMVCNHCSESATPHVTPMRLAPTTWDERRDAKAAWVLNRGRVLAICRCGQPWSIFPEEVTADGRMMYGHHEPDTPPDERQCSRCGYRGPVVLQGWVPARADSAPDGED